MAGVLKHGFASTKPNTSDPTKVGSTKWNAEHAFAGGNLGALLFRDTAETDGANWLNSVAAGSFLRSAGVGAAPVWSTTTWPNSATQGDLVYASAANAFGTLAAVATGQVLASAGVGAAPAWTATPTLTSIQLANTGLKVLDTDASHTLAFVPGSNITANRTLTFVTGDASRTVTYSGNPTLDDWFDQSVKAAASPAFVATTLTGGTVTASTPVVNATQTWNNSGVTFTGLLLNVTDTASGASSRLVDWQVAGSSKFRVVKDGSFTAAGGASVGGTIEWSGATQLLGTTNGTLLARNTAGTAGVTLDFATDAVLKVQSRSAGAASLAIGATTAGTGELRFAKSFSIKARNNGNTADLSILGTNANDHIVLDSGGTGVDLGAPTVAMAGQLNIAHGSRFLVGEASTPGSGVTLLEWGNTGNDNLRIGTQAGTTRIRSNLATPSTSLTDGDWWVDVSGVSPSRVAAIKVRDGGVTKTIASITY